MNNDFISYNVAYNSDRRSVTYHKITCAGLLEENSENLSTNYSILLPMCTLISCMSIWHSVADLHTASFSESFALRDKSDIQLPNYRNSPTLPYTYIEDSNLCPNIEVMQYLAKLRGKFNK
jgi:hypothetical protein